MNVVKLLSPSFGAVNLENIKAPECFDIEPQLKEQMDIPVFHDDQHGTAIVVLAGLYNALELANKNSHSEVKIVINGGGASGIATQRLLVQAGFAPPNIITCDTAGVIYKGRAENMNAHKQHLVVETEKRTLAEALEGADVVIGLSSAGAISPDMIKKMAATPIVLALALPDPEILPSQVLAVNENAIIATSRSDFFNQLNNVLAFPYIMRAVLDTRSSKVTDNMMLAAAKAIAELAKLEVPQEVVEAYGGKKFAFSASYLVPTPFDPRLMTEVTKAVAKAAIEDGVTQVENVDWSVYHKQLLEVRKTAEAPSVYH